MHGVGFRQGVGITYRVGLSKEWAKCRCNAGYAVKTGSEHKW